MLNNGETLIVKKGKTTVCLFLTLLCFFAFTVYANSVRNLSFYLAAPFVSVEAEKLVFCKYKAFGTEDSFDKYLTDYVEREKNLLKSKNEFIVVKIKGEYSVERKADYVLVREEGVPELNAEIYIAKNFDVAGDSLPCKTVVLLMQKAIKALLYTVFSAVFLYFYIQVGKFFLLKSTNRAFKILTCF